MDQLTLSIKDAAKLSKIGMQELYWQAKNNPRFPAFKIGKKILVHKEDFENWVANLALQRTGFKK